MINIGDNINRSLIGCLNETQNEMSRKTLITPHPNIFRLSLSSAFQTEKKTTSKTSFVCSHFLFTLK